MSWDMCPSSKHVSCLHAINCLIPYPRHFQQQLQMISRNLSKLSSGVVGCVPTLCVRPSVRPTVRPKMNRPRLRVVAFSGSFSWLASPSRACAAPRVRKGESDGMDEGTNERDCKKKEQVKQKPPPPPPPPSQLRGEMRGEKRAEGRSEVYCPKLNLMTSLDRPHLIPFFRCSIRRRRRVSERAASRS